MPTQSEDLQAPEEASQEEPSRSAIWKILINIQANVAKILNENQELRKDIENLKESIQFSDEQVAIVKKVNEELVQESNALEFTTWDSECKTLNSTTMCWNNIRGNLISRCTVYRNAKVRTWQILSSK